MSEHLKQFDLDTFTILQRDVTLNLEEFCVKKEGAIMMPNSSRADELHLKAHASYVEAVRLVAQHLGDYPGNQRNILQAAELGIASVRKSFIALLDTDLGNVFEADVVTHFLEDAQKYPDLEGYNPATIVSPDMDYSRMM